VTCCPDCREPYAPGTPPGERYHSGACPERWPKLIPANPEALVEELWEEAEFAGWDLPESTLLERGTFQR
jgi:hypothetical protein